MRLTPGTPIGPYAIVAAIGAGGMGEVYRARDARLERDVAIKVLPPLFARDPERLARFEREARTLAALNHPHIAQVYGVVDLPADAGGRALVMEFVDGEDLSARVARGAIPLDEALPIALQIAEALEAAHAQGIVHRDLKPANVKLGAADTVKVLDFGLAKALAPVDAMPQGIQNSPTITSPFQMSQLGVVLGTAAYMAPEQAKGKAVDKRADIWAFGCVLFEMLTGRRAFDGEDVTDVLAAIVRAEPDWPQLPAATPPAVRTLLRRCLEKDPRERLPDIGAARLELRDARVAPPAAVIAVPPPASRSSSTLPWLIAAAAAMVAVGAVARSTITRPLPETRVFKSLIMPPAALSGAPALRLQVSPDGRRLAFVAADETGRVVLWVRPLDGLTAQPLAGTADASSPVWSPDSRWIAFQSDGKLKKIDTVGGSIVTITSATQSPPGAWSKDDVILFSLNGVLQRVPAAGGTPVPVTRLGEGERIHISPSFLPDGRHFVYSTSTVDSLHGAAFVAALDSVDRTRLFEGSTNVMYADGHLLFVRDGNLMAQRFDPDARALSGSPIPLAEGVQMNPATGTGAFSASQNGVLVYQTGTFAGTQLVLYDRAGRVISTPADARGYRDVQMSADGRFACVTVSKADTSSVWIVDLAKGQGRPVTFSDEYALSAVWTRDGRSIVYAARRGGALDVYRRPASGNGAEELLLRNATDKLPMGFTPDGNMLLYRIPRAAAAGELWLLPMAGDRTPRPFAKGNSSQVPAEVSPDGKWLAYVSDESTRREVYVTSFPSGTGKWLVSGNGGDNPRWRADGRELFYSSSNSLVAVSVTSDDASFETGPGRTLFSIYVPAAALATRTTYAAAADGQRFLVNTWDPRAALTPITLVVNWTQTLAR